MTVEEFKEFVKTGQSIDRSEVVAVLHMQNKEARKLTSKLNNGYHTLEEIRDILSQLFGYKIPENFRVFPPFYTDFGRNIHIGDNVFINACCQFQDQGGVWLGDGCLIGHNAVFATLNHDMNPERRQICVPKSIVVGKNMDRLQCHHLRWRENRRQCRCGSRCSRNERCGSKYNSRGCSGQIHQIDIVKILFINGSPDKSGHTVRLAE